MNIPEIYRRLDEAQKKMAYLQMLTMDYLAMAFHADRHGRIHPTVNPAAGRARAVLTYENLWSNVSSDMFDRVMAGLEEARRNLTARLKETSKRIQADLSDSFEPGTVSFWREGDRWLETYLHHPMWECRHRMLFVDAYRNSRGEVEIFLCRGNLAEMPEEYQASFITCCWEKHAAGNGAAIDTDAPPPMTDDEETDSVATQAFAAKSVSTSYLIH